MPEIRVAKTVEAGSASKMGTTSVTIAIDEGASDLPVCNSGQTRAIATVDGSTTALIDRSGGFGLIANSGAIIAAAGAAGRNITVDICQYGRRDRVASCRPNRGGAGVDRRRHLLR